MWCLPTFLRSEKITGCWHRWRHRVVITEEQTLPPVSRDSTDHGYCPTLLDSPRPLPSSGALSRQTSERAANNRFWFTLLTRVHWRKLDGGQATISRRSWPWISSHWLWPVLRQCGQAIMFCCCRFFSLISEIPRTIATKLNHMLGSECKLGNWIRNFKSSLFSSSLKFGA